ncbi:MAG: RdgB/HAM1 family non-canonical purine NTP pyrophosphatase [Deltaproteobacteria bacterium]|nr:RdgB/HAM1 family non-canonical purine NTP pyrophosphatase [Deltaproteobacteria bacterium]
MTRLLLATANRGKLRELRDLLGTAIEVVTPEQCELSLDVEETGQTFADNAVLKAEAGAAACGQICVADDSGLCVDALGGAPGVHSARFALLAGRGQGDEANRRHLLEKMAAIDDGARGAEFRCAIAVAAPGRQTRVFTGSCRGAIARAPRGGDGFGYDPLFEWRDGRTFAELPLAEKQQVSHRGQALRAAAPYLLELARSNFWR